MRVIEVRFERFDARVAGGWIRVLWWRTVGLLVLRRVLGCAVRWSVVRRLVWRRRSLVEVLLRPWLRLTGRTVLVV